MNLDDIMGDFPARPDHPDFWRLSSIILGFDASMDEASTEEERSKVFETWLAKVIDGDSLAYMAFQRAMRGLEINTGGEVIANVRGLVLLSSAYMEAFLVGAAFVTDR